MFGKKGTEPAASPAPKYQAGDIVVWDRHGRRLARYIKQFRADDGDLFHQVIEIAQEAGKPMPMLAEDADLAPLGDRQFFAFGSDVYHWSDAAPIIVANAENDEAALNLADLLERAHRTPTADHVYAGIEHGDEKHRAWLRSAIDALFAGETVPRPTS